MCCDSLNVTRVTLVYPFCTVARSLAQINFNFQCSVMRDEFVNHSDLAAFAASSVNLKRDDAVDYREQVNRLRLKMEVFIKDRPDVGLRKMLLSGSLAKGTALKTLNDLDVALHVTSPDAPSGEADLPNSSP